METLTVYMNGIEIGEYVQSRGGAQEFHYADSWLANKKAIPVSLSLPLTEKTHRGEAVLNYFDNLLPDSRDIRDRIQARVGAKSNRPFDMLAEIGRDCIGAIQLLSNKSRIDVKKIKSIPLSDSEIADQLRNYRTMPLGMNRDDEFRISLAGAQEKTALLFNEGSWQKPIGPTPTTHIFKLPIGRIEHAGIDLSQSIENEWLCLKLLKAFGLNVAEAEIKRFEDQKVLVVTRFDREYAEDGSWIIRQPVEDMCQATGVSPALKYESDGGPGIQAIMDVLQSSLNPAIDRRHFMMSVFIFWLLGAIDGHAKNFSIFLHSGGRFLLTPLYDVISAHPLTANREIEYKNLKMAMAVHGKNTHYAAHEIMPRHWFSESKTASFPQTEMQAIIDGVVGSLDTTIASVANSLPEDFPEHIAEPVFTGIKDMSRQMENA